MKNRDQVILEKIYKRNILENNSNEIRNKIEEFFLDGSDWVKSVFMRIVDENGIENLSETYEYFKDFHDRFLMRKTENDPVLHKALISIKKTIDFLESLKK
jgi:hypothetical protein